MMWRRSLTHGIAVRCDHQGQLSDMLRILLFLVFPLVAGCSARAAAARPTPRSAASQPTLAARLGYPADAKLLIIHGDDLGMTHSIDVASLDALASGTITSASAMPVTPWFPEVAQYAHTHQDADIGLHLTLTSERTHLRWGPAASADGVRSLLDSAGYFRQGWTDTTRIDGADVERE